MQESEGEDAAESRVTLAEDVGRGNLASRQSRVKLQEASLQVALLLPGPLSRALSFSSGYSLMDAVDCCSPVIMCHLHFGVMTT